MTWRAFCSAAQTRLRSGGRQSRSGCPKPPVAALPEGWEAGARRRASGVRKLRVEGIGCAGAPARIRGEGGEDQRRWVRVAARRVSTLAVAALCIGCGNPRPDPRQTPPAVTVTRPVVEPVTEYLDMTGSVAPSRTVALVARVPGYLQSVNFEDGTYVEQGRLLFVIEPEPYEQQLRLAQAQRMRAQSEYDRQLELIRENATSSASVEKWLSQRDQAVAQEELAKLNLGYTRVAAPFSGRIGNRLVDPGNMVGTGGATQLATLDQLVPIYVNFSMSERDALRVRDEMRRLGMEPRAGGRRVPVLVGLLNEDGNPHPGTLDFVDSSVNTSTGTIQMRGVFENRDKALFPGAFARVRIALGDPRPMPVVPCRAIGNDQEGDYVLVAGPDDTVARRAVVKGPATDNGCAIRQGLSSEDRVIVNGLLMAKPGEKVTPVDREAAAPAPADPAR
jgi:RND family efflux transporter MFP subunit